MMKKLILFAGLFLMAIMVVSAGPPMPNAFYGDVTLNNGTFPNGYFITAKIGDVLSGECAIIDSSYGKAGNSCIIISYTEGIIDFFIGNTKIGEHAFEDKSIIELDFNLDSLPAYIGNSANGICEVERGECYFNLADCDASKTNACEGNSVCDSGIGETCSNAPIDCSACPVPPSGGGSSGGSGGGGGGSVATTPTSGEDGFETLSSDADETSEEISVGGGMTGGVIGAGSNKGISTLLVVLFIFLVGVLGYFGWKRYSKK